MERFATIANGFSPLTGVQPEIFQGRGDFVELEYFDENFVKSGRKEDCRRKLGFFSWILLKLHFEWKV